jgi:hypothetical protein
MTNLLTLLVAEPATQEAVLWIIGIELVGFIGIGMMIAALHDEFLVKFNKILSKLPLDKEKTP